MNVVDAVRRTEDTTVSVGEEYTATQALSRQTWLGLGVGGTSTEKDISREETERLKGAGKMGVLGDD